MKPGNKWCTVCNWEHDPLTPSSTFACGDCKFNTSLIEEAEEHSLGNRYHTVHVLVHVLEDEQPKLQRITGFGGQKAHLSRNGMVSICGMVHSWRIMPAADNQPLCGHCRKMEPDANPA